MTYPFLLGCSREFTLDALLHAYEKVNDVFAVLNI